MLAAGKIKFWFLAAFSLGLLSPPLFSPLVCNSFLPPMPERFCPGRKSMNVFSGTMRRRYRKKNSGLRQGCGQSGTILETKMHGAVWKIQRHDVEPAYKKLSM